jgi:RimJ/RimL family protein N-acetyltransferase
MIESSVLSAFLSLRNRLDRWVWVAMEKQSHAFAGWFSLRPPDGGAIDTAELGFRLRKQFWNRGYGTEGTKALVDKGSADLGLQRTYAETMFVNRASRRVLEKAGLKYGAHVTPRLG